MSRSRPPGLRNPFDRYGKEAISTVLERGGRVRTQVKTQMEPQYADLRFLPNPTKLPALEPFGWLARMATTDTLMEFFHQPPSAEAIRECMCKQLVARQKSKSTGRAKSEVALWILSAGRPTLALRALGFVRDRRWSRGVYRLEREFHVHLMVVNELPRTRATLLLRLLGAGTTLRSAFADFFALPDQSPERGALQPAVVQLVSELNEIREHTSAEEQELIMDVVAKYEAWKEDLIAQGKKRGRAEGEKRGRAEGEKLGRAEALRQQLQAKFPKASKRALAPLETATPKQLERWTLRVLTATTLEEVFG